MEIFVAFVSGDNIDSGIVKITHTESMMKEFINEYCGRKVYRGVGYYDTGFRCAQGVRVFTHTIKNPSKTIYAIHTLDDNGNDFLYINGRLRKTELIECIKAGLFYLKDSQIEAIVDTNLHKFDSSRFNFTLDDGDYSIYITSQKYCVSQDRITEMQTYETQEFNI